jgi:uncharacterized membrane protein
VQSKPAQSTPGSRKESEASGHSTILSSGYCRERHEKVSLIGRAGASVMLPLLFHWKLLIVAWTNFAWTNFVGSIFVGSSGVFGIDGQVFWPYFAGAAALALGLVFLPTQEIRRAHGFDKLIWFGPLLVAMPMAIFGADHFMFAKFVAMIVPKWMPWRLFWAYFVGVALLAAAAGLTTRIYWRLAATMLGIMLLLFVLMMHIPNFIRLPHLISVRALLLRDTTLGAGIFSFAAWRNLEATERGGHAGFREVGSPLVVIIRVLVAIPIAIFGILHIQNPAFAPGFPQDDPSLFISLPSSIPAHVLWGYINGAIFIGCAVGLLTRRFARRSAMTLGVTVLVFVVVAYLPLTIRHASDVTTGLNYLAIHLALAGATLMLAGAIPPPGCLGEKKSGSGQL